MRTETDNINDLMQALTALPKPQFDAAVTAVAVLAMGTIRDMHGDDYLAGLCEAAMTDKGQVPCLKWQGPKH